MFEKLDDSSDRVVGFKLSGRLTDADYKGIAPHFEKAIEEYDKICILWELEDFHGWEAKAAWDDYKYWRKWKGNIASLAIVGDKKWEEWMTKLSKLFMWSAEVRYFDHSQIQEAWEWLREKG